MQTLSLLAKKQLDTKDKNAATMIQRSFTAMGYDANIKDLDTDVLLDCNGIKVLMCSNLVFNGNARYLKQLVKNAASLNDAVVFLVEKTLLSKVGIMEELPKESSWLDKCVCRRTRASSDLKNDENIVVIKDYSWEKTGLNSSQADKIGKRIVKAVMDKEKQLANAKK